MIQRSQDIFQCGNFYLITKTSEWLWSHIHWMYLLFSLYSNQESELIIIIFWGRSFFIIHTSQFQTEITFETSFQRTFWLLLYKMKLWYLQKNVCVIDIIQALTAKYLTLYSFIHHLFNGTLWITNGNFHNLFS